MSNKKSLNPNTIFSEDYNNLRDLYRLILLYGCYTGAEIASGIIYQLPRRKDGKGAIRKSTYSTKSKQLHYLLNQLKLPSGKAKTYYIDNDIYDNQDDNPLKTFKIHNFTENQIMYFFLLIQAVQKLTSEYNETFTLNQLADDISDSFEGDTNLPKNFSHFLESLSEVLENDSKPDKSSLFRSYFTEMVEAGYFLKLPKEESISINQDNYSLQEDSFTRREYYKIARDRLEELDDDTIDNLVILLEHFSKANPLCVPYYLAKERIKAYYDTEENSNIFLFRHNPIYGAIDNEIMYELLIAIKNKKACSIEYKDTNADYSNDNFYTLSNAVILPRYILTSEEDGRQFVFCFNITKNEVQSLRLDYIDSIETKEHAFTDEEKDWLKKIEDNIDHVWSFSAYNFLGKITPITITFTFDENDYFNKLQLQKISDRFPIKKISTTEFEITFDIFDYKEMKPWLKSFGSHIYIHEDSSEATNLKKELENEWKELAKIYEII